MSRPPEDDEHVLGPGLLPTPFTAAQIRASSRDGKLIRLLVESADGTVVERINRFRDADDEGANLEQWLSDAPDDATTRRVTWLELQSHAAFPTELTTVSTEVIELPLGRLECVRYDVIATDADPAATFWFALAHPGMPVRYQTVTASGRIRTTVTAITSD
ncbi:hypothetical protein [Microbacterium sp. H1-D42]|uniref:hypothetical protein n=1 Tax=Microbacterium sp. H1-D42 TaxID=2925844 RepID=UPI001F53705C|nr:hypothetical protein [Microbacterium sp. H1-D42]UNK70577.1 hypothetical protein MNR00_15670 [Microbacterium sp. H1-D42]